MMYDDSTHIQDLPFSVRSRNSLESVGIDTLGKLRAASDRVLNNIRNFGTTSLLEARKFMKENPQKTTDEDSAITHVGLDQLVWEASLVALQGFLSAASVCIKDGELRINPSALRGIDALSHTIGTRMAVRHLSWLFKGTLPSEDIDNLSDDASSRTARDILKCVEEVHSA